MSDDSSRSNRSKGRDGDRPKSSGSDRRPGGRGRESDAGGRGSDRRRGEGGRREPESHDDPGLAGPLSWGRLARRGAGGLGEEPEPSHQSERPDKRRSGSDDDTSQDDTSAEDSSDEPPTRRIPEPPERNLPDGDDLKRSAERAVSRARKPVSRERRPLPPRPHSVTDPEVAMTRLVGEQRARRLVRRLNDAGREFAADRFDESRKILTPLVKEVPELPEGRELFGLTLYRLGRWKDAVVSLEAFRELSGSTEQHPVLADCHRAMGHWSDVDFLWQELGDASPSSALVIEGRIVLAGAKSDQGDVVGAIAVLEDGWRAPKKPRPHHLRRAYALADLYERAGRTPRARQLFTWVANHDPDLADVRARVRALN